MTKKCPKLEKFNMRLETVNFDAPIGHLFVADIDFNFEKATAKTLVYNVYTKMFEKQKMLDPTEKSVFQLSETLRMAYKTFYHF